jgi:molybdopterin-biosynthesis enzyme MoeA-like protein
MRGRPPIPNPPGIARTVRKRHEIQYWAAGWPKKFGPMLRVRKRMPTGRRRGRPSMALKEAIRHFVVEARVRTYLDSGQKLKTAVWDALKSLNWPDQSEREFERIQTFLRRRRKVVEAANRRRARPRKPSGRPVCELSAVAARWSNAGSNYRQIIVGEN